MRWQKRGNIFNPQQHRAWAGTHAQVPTVLVKQQVLRIYYADRDNQGRSFTTYLDVDRADPTRVVYLHKRPLLPLGRPGTFDDEGMMPAFALERAGRIYLYYSGWNRRLTVPYHNATGLAVSDDGGDSFQRLYEGPILDRLPLEPYLAVTPCVLQDGDRWQMWYISGVEWARVGDKFEPVYVIKYGHSQDGIHWERPNVLSVKPRHDKEAFSHPCVVKSGGRYRMWYCFRESEDYRDGRGSYRIGYAVSDGGQEFERRDHDAGITVSAEGWDSTMICYPYVIAADGRTMMFYNGNGFGQTGIGYAVLEE
jgi:predicted GH43/DUF377 family glycosyl hydrolase